MRNNMQEYAVFFQTECFYNESRVIAIFSIYIVVVHVLWLREFVCKTIAVDMMNHNTGNTVLAHTSNAKRFGLVTQNVIHKKFTRKIFSSIA